MYTYSCVMYLSYLGCGVEICHIHMYTVQNLIILPCSGKFSYTVKRHFSVRVLFMRIMRVKRRAHKFVLHKFFIALYITIHETIKKRRFSVDNLVIGVKLADVSTRCSSHLQGKGEARCENAEAL